MDISQAALDELLRDQSRETHAIKARWPHLKGGEIVDQLIHILNRKNQTDRYGRKARRADGSDLNDDVVAIRLVDADHGRKKMIDALGNAHPGDQDKPEDVPTWSIVPAHEEAGNGYWAPAEGADLEDDKEEEPGTGGVGGGGGTGGGTGAQPGGGGEVLAALLALSAQVEALGVRVDELRRLVGGLEAQPFPTYQGRIFGQSVTLTPKP